MVSDPALRMFARVVSARVEASSASKIVVTCDRCSGKITGTRAKCADCVDYDLVSSLPSSVHLAQKRIDSPFTTVPRLLSISQELPPA